MGYWHRLDRHPGTSSSSHPEAFNSKEIDDSSTHPPTHSLLLQEIAQDVHHNIRAILADAYGKAIADATVIQYGGSVTPETVDELMAQPDIDGALVGGASLVGEKFARIINFEKK